MTKHCAHCERPTLEYIGFVNEGEVYKCGRCNRHTRFMCGKQPAASSWDRPDSSDGLPPSNLARQGG